MLRSLTDKLFSFLSGDLKSGTPDKIYIQPKKRQTTKRRGDMVMIVCQRNDMKKIEIEGVDKETEIRTGFSQEDLTRKTINEILPTQINEAIESYVEYSPEGNDLASVLGKVRDFAVVDKNKKNIPVNLRIVSATSNDNNPRFFLIMSETSLKKVISDAKSRLLEKIHESSIIDEVTGLQNKSSFIEDLQTAKRFIDQKNVLATLVVIAVDKFEEIDQKFGKEFGNKIISDVGKICSNCFRDDDIVAYLGGNRIGVLLVDADADAAKAALNRLRWMVSSRVIEHDGKKTNISVSASCHQFIRGEEVDNMLGICNSATDQAEAEGGNTVIVA